MSKQLVIMLVDDNKIDLFIHAEVLKHLPGVGNLMQYAFAGDALNYLEEHEAAQWPDVILLDIHMPIMNGFDFLAKYEQLPGDARSRCRIIMVSSSLDNGDMKRAGASSAVYGFLEKPLNLDKLRQLIGQP